MTSDDKDQKSDDRRSDAELIRAFVRQHDSSAIDTIVQRHGPMVMGVCRSILQRHHAVDDAFQATFLVLLNKAGSIGKPASLACWLHGVACRVSKRARSQPKSQTLETSGLQMNSTDPAGLAATEECLNLIHEEIEQLPEQFRLPLILCGIEGETKEHVAQQLGWTVGSVKGRLERARDLLQRRLKTRGVALPAAMVSVLLAEQAIAQVPTALASSTAIAAAQVASGSLMAGGPISANSILLSKEVIHIMLIANIKLAAVSLCAVCAFVGVTTLIVRQISAAPPDNNPVVAALAQAVAAQPTKSNPVADETTPADPQWNDLNDEQIDEISLRHLKAISLAMQAYLEKYKAFPPASVPNPNLPVEKRLSGLVLLLPYLGVRPSWLPENDAGWKKWHSDNATARQLFEKIDLKKAWDDPTNAAAAKTLVREFVAPGGAELRDKQGYAVSHFAFVRGVDGKDNGIFPLERGKGTTVKEVVDGTSTTLAMGQIHDNLGPWIAAGPSTARFALPSPDKSGKPGFEGPHSGCGYVANADSSVYFLDFGRTNKKVVRLLAGRADESLFNLEDVARFANSVEWKAARETGKSK